MAAALVKVPMLATSSALWHFAFRPPNPPAKADERAKYGDTDPTANLIAAVVGRSIAFVGKVRLGNLSCARDIFAIDSWT